MEIITKPFTVDSLAQRAQAILSTPVQYYLGYLTSEADIGSFEAPTTRRTMGDNQCRVLAHRDRAACRFRGRYWQRT
jgi:hypothetical protein